MDDSFRHIWDCVFVSSDELAELKNRRGKIKSYMDKIGRNVIKSNGIESFEDEQKNEVISFVEDMKLYGIYFVPKGELECWLSGLGVDRTSNKPAWLTQIFSALGSDPMDQNYIKAGDDDVWQFIDSIKVWFDNPGRLGIPD